MIKRESLLKRKGMGGTGRPLLLFGAICFPMLMSPACSILQTRPIQEMSDTAAAVKAAKEVEADTRSPELFRQASDLFFRARQEYKLKNFKRAREYAAKARILAEQAEFESIRKGGVRSEPVDLQAPQSPPEPPYPYPTPTGIPVESYDRQMQGTPPASPPPFGAP